MASPTLYLNHMYDDYVKNNDFDLIMKSTMRGFQEALQYERHHLNIADKLTNEYILDNAVVTLVNTDMNTNLLKDIPHHNFLDLSIIYRIVIEMYNGEIKTAIINNLILEQLNISEDKLYEIAIKNTDKLFPPQLEKFTSEFTILTNQHFFNGSASILNIKMLSQIAEELNDNIFLLPSSIHEFIAIQQYQRSVDELKQLVNEVNNDFVSPEEILSYSIYQFNKDTKEVSIAL